MKDVSNTRRLAGVCFCTTFIIACATPPQTRLLLTEPPASLPVRVELNATPFYPQQRYQCGPAALATVLGAHSVDVTPEKLVTAVFVPALHGSLPEEITATARRYGMLAYPLQPSLANLVSEVAQGNPVLVFQNLGTRWLPRWHFAVVVGYDLATHEVILRSGTSRRWHTTLATLERTWSRSGYWALVILPAGHIPVTALPERYLQAVHDLEASDQAAAALAAWRAAIHRWPDNPRAWMAYGNNRYAAAAYGQAETAFRKAVMLAPGYPQGWNNLAYALLHTACPRQAQQAASCAAGLAPESPNYQDTMEEINARGHGDDAPHCIPVDCMPAADPPGVLQHESSPVPDVILRNKKQDTTTGLFLDD
jgi:hypothetical protein